MRAIRLQLVKLIDKYAETYRELRNSYVSKIKRCKKETWQKNFVNEEENKDPVGYRIQDSTRKVSKIVLLGSSEIV